MKRLIVLVPLVLVTLGWLYSKGYRLDGLQQVHVGTAGTTGPDGEAGPTVDRQSPTITIASFNIQVLGEAKLAKPEVVDVLAKVIRRFDVVAIQEVRSVNNDILPRLVEKINAEGAHYDFAIGPRLGRTSSKEQYAFIYDRTSLELDRNSIYTVDDPDDLLHREPLVAGFRVRGPPPESAFTFTLVNIHTDPDELAAELNVLDDVVRAVRADGREEDDVILLGDLNADDKHLGELGQIPYITWAISGKPSNTRGTKLYDNILFDSKATSEFTGRSGVLDLKSEYKLTTEQALAVSDHFPVWAEFNITEGGQKGRVAAKAATVR